MGEKRAEMSINTKEQHVDLSKNIIWVQRWCCISLVLVKISNPMCMVCVKESINFFEKEL